jgi:Zn-dependent peptidase ImmA (M78 family)
MMQQVSHAGRKHPKITNWSEIIELYKKGYSTVELAKIYGVTPQAVWLVLRQQGLIRSRADAQKLRSMKVQLKKTGGEKVG